MMQFYMPTAALDEICRDHGVARINGLHWPYGQIDPVVHHMALSILPALERPGGINTLFTDYAMLALCGHFLHRYGDMRAPSRSTRGGLAPWQERRAKEILSAHIDGELSIDAIARECKLSASYFTKAFKVSTGTSPYRWLIAHRIERAKDYLLGSELALTDIALTCGFCDQSHFNRVFQRIVGKSPGVWRRARQH
jgi:AraC-like DNA-binding protein